jgi:hypothetical protein
MNNDSIVPERPTGAQRRPPSALAAEEIVYIRRTLTVGGVRQKDIAQDFLVTQMTISLIWRGKIRPDLKVDVHEKWCTKCRTTKDVELFFKNSRNDKPRSWCKSCCNRTGAEWEKRNPALVRKYALNSYRNNHEKCVLRSRKYHRTVGRKRMYGITPEQYDQMLASQGGLCAVCRNPERRVLHGTVTSLAVDHCHQTKKIRGLLCSQCNLIIGGAKDDPTLLRRLAAYLDGTA